MHIRNNAETLMFITISDCFKCRISLSYNNFKSRYKYSFKYFNKEKIIVNYNR